MPDGSGMGQNKRGERNTLTMGIETIIAYIIAMGLLAATPGPGVFATVAQAVTKGVGPAFAMLTGLVVADIIYLVAAATGLGLLAQQFGEAFTLLRYIGAAYLIWLGWTSWTAPKNMAQKPKAAAKSRSFIAGFLISLSNPKVIVFYLAFLPTFVDLQAIQEADVGILALITAVLSYIILGSYIYGARHVGQSLIQPAMKKRFDRAAGTMLIGTGIFVAARN